MTQEEKFSPFNSDQPDSFSRSRFEDPPEIKIERPNLSWQNHTQTHYQSVGLGLSLSYSLILSPISGMLIGWFLEQKYKVSDGLVWGLAIGSVLGFIMVLLTLSRNK